MPSWFNFASVSGAVTILAFIAECLKAFPRFAEFRRGFLLVSFGFFLGSLVTASSGTLIVLSPDGSPLVLLMTICVGLALLFLFLAVMAEVQARKTEFYVLSAASVFGFFVLLFIHGMSTAGGHTTVMGELSFREKVWLGEKAYSAGDDERAVEVFEDASKDLPTGDPRSAALAEKIELAKRRQLDGDMKAVR